MMSNRILAMLATCILMTQVSFGDVWQDIAGYEYGDAPNPCEQAELLLQETPVNQYGPVEQKLIAVVASKDATQAGKAVACRFLQQIGSDKCIAAVSGLLSDEILSDYARLVLERLKSAEADKAMRDALEQAPDIAKVGILASLGERRDIKALTAAAKLANSANSAVAEAAIQAIGKIGGREAARCLSSMKPAKELVPAQMQAMVACVRSLSGSAAVSLCEKVLAGPWDPCRTAALRELTNADAAKASDLIVAAIKGNDLKLRRGALGIVADTKGLRMTRSMIDLLKVLPTERKAEMIAALGARADTKALGSITGYLQSKDAVIRNAAIKAAGKLGDAGVVKLLLYAADSPESEAAVTKAIAGMKGDGIDAVLVESLGYRNLRQAAIRACIAHGSTEAVGDLLKLLKDRDADVRKDVWAGLAALADADDMDSIMNAAIEIRDAKDLVFAEGAIKEIFSRSQDRGKCFQAIADHYKAATETLKYAILDLGAVTGDSIALELERNALTSRNKKLYIRALRALAKWPNKSAAEDILTQAKTAPETVDRIIALRGYIRIAGLDSADLSAAERVKMLKTALGLTQRNNEKKLIVSALQQAKSLESLDMLKKYIDDPALGAEAQMSAANLIWDMRKKHPAEIAPIAAQLAKSKNKAVADKAKKTLAELKKAKAP
ncbi:MAG: HEAT repeat domain-containing protein [Planctomycetes bacterium]|nr:HEAT repeat domain-containing protein [Planctomycetota bacterium]